MSNSTQNDWEVRFNDRFMNNWGTLLDIKHFIRKELADARREERAYIIDLIQDEHNFTWVGVEGMCLIKDIVATLREEEGK